MVAAVGKLLAGALLLAGGAWVVVPHADADAPAAADVPLAASQAGTQVDGGAHATGDELVVDDALRRRFEYYLADIGERPLDAVMAGIDADLARNLPPKAAQAAGALLRRYVAYRRALGELGKDAVPPGDDPASLRARLDVQRTLRTRFFSLAESQGLFGWLDAYDDDALAHLTIARDTTLGAAAKAQRLAELDRHLPPEVVAARQAPVAYLALDKAVQAARATGAGDAEIYKMRAASVGEDAATRLAALDRDESAWKQRLDGYLADRKAILADTALDETSRTAAIQKLRDARFNAQEQLRLTAYE